MTIESSIALTVPSSQNKSFGSQVLLAKESVSTGSPSGSDWRCSRAEKEDGGGSTASNRFKGT